MMVWKWRKMVRRLNHRDVFESAIQNILDYFSNRVSEPFLTYRNKLINEADEGQCRRVKRERVEVTHRCSIYYTKQCEARTPSHSALYDTAAVLHCVNYSQERSEPRTGGCGSIEIAGGIYILTPTR